MELTLTKNTKQYPESFANVNIEPVELWIGMSADRSNWQEMTTKYAAQCFAELTPLAIHIGQHHLDGEDLLAEAFERTMRLWAKGHGPTENVNGYLVRSMQNRVLDELRSPRSKVVGIPDGYETHAVQGDPEMEFERSEQREAIYSALSQLPPTSRDLVIGVFVLGQKVSELALSTGMTVNAISLRLSRAKRTLRETLAADPRISERYAA